LIEHFGDDQTLNFVTIFTDYEIHKTYESYSAMRLNFSI